MSWKFNPPPGWPEQPEGWVPPPGWTPDPNWPPPPAGWQFWVPAGTASAPPASAPPPAAPPPAAPPPAAPPPAAPTMVPPHTGQAGSGPPLPSTPPSPYASGPPAPFGSAPPGQFGPGPGAPPYPAATRAPKPWFGQWWGILGLIALLLLGAAIGYGATRVALDASDDNSALGPAVTAYDLSQTVADRDRGAAR